GGRLGEGDEMAAEEETRAQAVGQSGGSPPHTVDGRSEIDRRQRRRHARPTHGTERLAPGHPHGHRDDRTHDRRHWSHYRCPTTSEPRVEEQQATQSQDACEQPRRYVRGERPASIEGYPRPDQDAP